MKLPVTLIQADLAWENPKENFQKFETFFEKVDDESDLIVLPEMFATGFSMKPENFEKPVGKEAFSWMQEQAKKNQKNIVGSILFEDSEKFYNRMFWMRPDGSFETYDKRHLFQMGRENEVMTAGKKKTIVMHKDVNFLLQICYDLRFPVWTKNRFDPEKKSYDYDVIIYVANWPEIRKTAYMNLLKARAIENQAYVIWVNRTGVDGHGILHSGDTQVVDPKGNILEVMSEFQEGLLQTELDIDLLKNYRKEFQVGLDWDTFSIQ